MRVYSCRSGAVLVSEGVLVWSEGVLVAEGEICREESGRGVDLSGGVGCPGRGGGRSVRRSRDEGWCSRGTCRRCWSGSAGCRDVVGRRCSARGQHALSPPPETGTALLVTVSGGGDGPIFLTNFSRGGARGEDVGEVRLVVGGIVAGRGAVFAELGVAGRGCRGARGRVWCRSEGLLV